MYIRVKDNIWTRVEWWDQLAKTDYDVVLRKVESDESETVLSLTGPRRSQEKLVNLLDDIHMAVINNTKVFDVQKWLNRFKRNKVKLEN